MSIEEIEDSVSSWDEFEGVIGENDDSGFEIPFVDGVVRSLQSDEDNGLSVDARDRRDEVLKSFNAKHRNLKELISVLEEYTGGECYELTDDGVEYFESITPVVEACYRLLDENEAYLTCDEQEMLRDDIETIEGMKEKLRWRVEYGEVLESVRPRVSEIENELVEIVQRSCDGEYDRTALNGEYYSLWVVNKLTNNDKKTSEKVSRRECVNACRVCSGTVNADLIDDTVKGRLLNELDSIEDQLHTAAPNQTETNAPEVVEMLFEKVSVFREVLTEYNSILADRHILKTVQQARGVKTKMLEVIDSEVSAGEDLTVSRGGFDVDSVPGGVAGCVRVIDKGYVEELHDVLSDLQMVTASRVLRASKTQKSSEAVRLEEELQVMLEAIENSVDSDDAINDVEEKVTVLRQDVESVLNASGYLHSDAKQDLLRECDEVLTDVLSVEESVTGEVTKHDRERIRELKGAVESIRDRVKTYNKKFIEDKRDAYSTMFSNMGEEKVSLNTQQEYGVFQNDKHNKVNAGAGTGKTFSVACRIQYLLCEGHRKRDIIALTFLREAAKTMEERLNRIFNVSGVSMRTLHSFGKEVLDEFDDDGFQLEGEPRMAELNRLVNQIIESNDAHKETFEAFTTRYKERVCDLDPGVQENVVKEYENRPMYTVHGEKIDSTNKEVQDVHGEISKWLSERGVEYEYRAFPECDGLQGIEPTRTDVYLPEFALPEHKVVIEYYPTQDVRMEQEWYEEKSAPEEINEWYENMQWDVVHITNPSSVHETLKTELTDKGVSVEEVLPHKEYVNSAYEEIVVTRGILDEIGDFVQLGKSNDVSAEEAEADVAAAEPEVRLFTSIAGEVLEKYQQRYEEINAYDYTDMIVKATNLLKSKRLPDSMTFNHVIVDEFQDLSRVQIEFIKTLLNVNDAKLFAVGDDWQSIYGFKGARPEYFVEFDEYFAPASETRLEENYRCPPSVVNAGNELIEENELRTIKEVEASKEEDSPPVVHPVAGGDRHRYVGNAAMKIEQLVVESITCDNRNPKDIVVIVRNKEGTTLPNRIRGRIMSHDIPTGNNGVGIKTAHQMKGMEEEHVIIANVGNLKKDSFPTAERDKELLEGVGTDTGSHIEEERRLFYVALTRAKQRLDLQVDGDEVPVFIDNINDHVVLGENINKSVEMTGEVTTTNSVENNETVTQVGTIKTRTGYEFDFAVSKNTPVSELKENTVYNVTNAIVDSHNGKTQLLMNEKTKVKRTQQNK